MWIKINNVRINITHLKLYYYTRDNETTPVSIHGVKLVNYNEESKPIIMQFSSELEAKSVIDKLDNLCKPELVV